MNCKSIEFNTIIGLESTAKVPHPDPKKYRIVIDLGKLKMLYSGLGQYSKQLASNLVKFEDPRYDWIFLVPRNFRNYFGSSVQYETITLLRRYFPFLYKEYDLWHAIHQDSSFFPKDRHHPYILTIHDLNFMEEKHGIKRKTRLSNLQAKVDRADAICFISHYSLKVANEYLDLSGKRMEVIYNGVEINTDFKTQRPHYLPDGKFLFTIGIILEKKNFHVLIPLMKELADYSLVIAGNDTYPYAGKVRKLIQENNLQDKIILPGKIPDEEKTYLYKHCEAFLFPSKLEGFGMPIIEAMRFGKPVFCSTYASLPEIAGDKAFFWEDFDPVNMKNLFLEKMDFFKQNQSAFSREIIEYSNKFTWDRTIAAYLAMYQKVIGELSGLDPELTYESNKSEKKVTSKLKVLHISSEKTMRGGERQIAYLAEELNKKEVDNLVVCHKGSMLEKYCQQHNIGYVSTRTSKPFNLLTALFIARLVRRYQYDILHLHTSVGHTLGILSTLFNHKAKLVLSRRVDFPVNKNIFSTWKYNHPRILKVIAVSKAIQEVLLQSSIRADKTTVVHSGVDIESIKGHSHAGTLRAKFNILKEMYIIGNTSALADHKDFFTFVDTAEFVIKRGLNACFFIIGDGSERNSIENYIVKKGLEKNIFMTGYINDAANLISEFDIFLMTSKMEGLGSTILDAFARKVPVVATDAGGIPEMVIHKKTGMLSPIKDSASLGENILKILNDSTLRETLVKNAYELLTQEFTKQIMAQRTFDIYRSALMED